MAKSFRLEANIQLVFRHIRIKSQVVITKYIRFMEYIRLIHIVLAKIYYYYIILIR